MLRRSVTALLPISLSLLYFPLQHVYSILNFHLTSPPSRFTETIDFTSAQIPNSNRLFQESTIYREDLTSFDRIAMCEDAIVWEKEPGRQVALFSCDPSRWEWNTVMGTLKNVNAGTGSLWILDPVSQEGAPTAKKIELKWPALQDNRGQFHPLGIDLIRDETGATLLFAINHQEFESTVDIFHLSCHSGTLDCTADHVRSLSDASFTGAPNSIAVTSPTHFYLSHDHRFNLRTRNPIRKFLNFVESVLALPLSYVDSISISSSTVSVERAISNIAFPNGIVVSPSGRTLVVASSTARSVYYYTRNPSTNSISKKPYRTVQLPFLVDNLSIGSASSMEHEEVSEAGTIDEEESFTVLATGHPSYLSLLAVAHQTTFSLPLLLTSTLRTLVSSSILSQLEDWTRRNLGKWEFDWKENRGMSWSVEIFPQRRSSHALGKKEDIEEEKKKEYRTIFESNGKGEKGYGSSSTTIVGSSSVSSLDVEREVINEANVEARLDENERQRKWMVVVGLYEEGVKVLVEQ